MTLLDEIIDGSTDSAVKTTDLLRKVQVAATRVGATDVVEWVRQELQGYVSAEAVPSYRVLNCNAVGVFAGPMRTTIRHHLPFDDRFADQFEMRFQQPLLTLQSFAEGDGDPTREWPPHEVERFDRLGIMTMEFHNLFSAHNTISSESLAGIVDIVRTKAMEFALELQGRFPEAGSTAGPTVRDNSEMAVAIYHVTNNITGHGTNIATGSGIDQASLVGDLDQLRSQIRAIGLETSDAEEFIDSVVEEKTLSGPRVEGFLSRVRSGAVSLTTSVASDVAAGSLIEIAKAYLGLS